MRRPCDAFLRGFGSVVPLPWVNMFSPAELQLVLGGSDAPLDVDDWRANAVFSGGYHTEHPVIRMLWQVLREYDPPKRAATLKFATSCSRPPLLGFAHLQPRFCVHMATDEEGRLPTAATCMNLLKLPPYENVETLREPAVAPEAVALKADESSPYDSNGDSSGDLEARGGGPRNAPVGLART